MPRLTDAAPGLEGAEGRGTWRDHPGIGRPRSSDQRPPSPSLGNSIGKCSPPIPTG